MDSGRGYTDLLAMCDSGQLISQSETVAAYLFLSTSQQNKQRRKLAFSFF